MRRTHIFVSWGKNKIEVVDDCVSFCARRSRMSCPGYIAEYLVRKQHGYRLYG